MLGRSIARSTLSGMLVGPGLAKKWRPRGLGIADPVGSPDVYRPKAARTRNRSRSGRHQIDALPLPGHHTLRPNEAGRSIDPRIFQSFAQHHTDIDRTER